MTTHQPSVASHRSPAVVIGGGIAGLTAAALLGRAGVPAVVLEQSATAGGRAATRDRNGFLFNLGPHALYRAGALMQTLQTLGVEVRGQVPGTSGGFALHGGRLHTLPVGLTSLLTTGLLSLAGKFELARLQPKLMLVDTNPIQSQPLAAWLDANVSDAGVRAVVEMLVRVTSFTNDPAGQSAGAAIDQLQLALKASVLYLDGGWQTIVDGLRRAAIDSGGRLVTGAQAVGVERDVVRLSDGRVLPAAGVIIAAGPAEVDSLVGTGFQSTLPPPIRLATLDVALRSLPKPAATVAFGIDVPLYFSVHSAVARLAPEGGALIHVSKYLQPGEHTGATVERELEALMDTMQPGWRTVVESRQFLPSLRVTNAEVTAAQGGLAGRPPAQLPMFDNVAIAGDWIGPRGQLSDAAASGAADAVAQVMAGLKARATSEGSEPVSPGFRPAVKAAS